MSNFGAEQDQGDAVEFDMDSTDEGAGGFQVLPRGTYDCVVEDVEFKHSQASGNPMWSWVLQVEDGEYAGRKLFFHSVFIEKMMPRVKQTLLRVAPELATGKLNPQKVAEDGLLVGRKLRARVNIRKYEGQDRNEVKEILAPSAEGAGGGFFAS